MVKQIIVKSFLLCMLLGYVLSPVRTLAQQPGVEVSAQTDTDRIRIGEQVKLLLSASIQDAGVKVAFPQLPDSFSHWEVIDRSAIDTTGDGGAKHFRQVVTLTSFDSGRWEIPPFRFDVVAGGSADSAFTKPLEIDVNTVAVDTTKAFKPIKNIRTVPWNFWDYWAYFAIGLAVVLLAIGLWLYFRKKPAKAPAPPPAPAVTPYEAAIQQLQQLSAEKVWQQGDVKQYYTRLMDILRAYFEAQFNIPALEQTSEELLQHIRPVTILNQQRDKLRGLLAIADLAKFAKLTPTPDEHEDCMHKALEIVEWTRPAAEKKPAESAAADGAIPAQKKE